MYIRNSTECVVNKITESLLPRNKYFWKFKGPFNEIKTHTINWCQAQHHNSFKNTIYKRLSKDVLASSSIITWELVRKERFSGLISNHILENLHGEGGGSKMQRTKRRRVLCEQSAFKQASPVILNVSTDSEPHIYCHVILLVSQSYLIFPWYFSIFFLSYYETMNHINSLVCVSLIYVCKKKWTV